MGVPPADLGVPPKSPHVRGTKYSQERRQQSTLHGSHEPPNNEATLSHFSSLAYRHCVASLFGSSALLAASHRHRPRRGARRAFRTCAVFPSCAVHRGHSLLRRIHSGILLHSAPQHTTFKMSAERMLFMETTTPLKVIPVCAKGFPRRRKRNHGRVKVQKSRPLPIWQRLDGVCSSRGDCVAVKH